MTATIERPAVLVTNPRRWRALAAVALGQLMIAADGTIVNLALPSIQREFGTSSQVTAWIAMSFGLCYGGLLLVGGRLADVLGLRRCLLAGLAGFATGSLLAGAATHPGVLIAGRILQGGFGALFTPSVLALIGTSFTKPAERAKAMGIYATVMGSSSGVGLLLGGVATDALGWRWSLYVAIPIAVVAAVGILHAVPVSDPRPGARVDVLGAVLVTAGLVTLSYAASRVARSGWQTSEVGIWLGAAALIGGFVWWQGRAEQPLLPLWVVRDRLRATGYLSVLCFAMGTFAAMYALTFHIQHTLGHPPVLAGLMMLPYPAAIMCAARLVGRLLARGVARRLLGGGLLICAMAVAVQSQLPTTGIVGPMVVVTLLGLATGLVLPPANSVATLGRDPGVAGALVMISMQVGAALGIAGFGDLLIPDTR